MKTKESHTPDENYIDVTAAVITQDDKVLITRRAPGKILAGKWEFPGGKIEQDETIEECLTREISEELAIDIQIQKPFFEFEYDYSRSDGKKHRFFSFLCDVPIKNELKLTAHDKVAWVTIDELSDFDFVEADLQLVDKIVKGGLV